MDDSTFHFAAALLSVTQSGDRLVSQVQKQRIQQEILLTEFAGDTKAAARVKDFLKGLGGIASESSTEAGPSKPIRRCSCTPARDATCRTTPAGPLLPVDAR